MERMSLISLFLKQSKLIIMSRFPIFIFLLAILSSCGGYNSIDNFYNDHKNDDQVTAIRVPQFMLAMISEISPEMKALVGNTKDLRFMQFPSATPARSQYLNAQMNGITGSSFIEVFRKNDELKRNVVSIREKRNSVKEILIYNNDNLSGSFLYFNGDFDPVKVREMAKNEQFTKFGENIISQFGPTTRGTQPNN